VGGVRRTPILPGANRGLPLKFLFLPQYRASTGGLYAGT
jgi:hypothetical protein